MLDGVILPWITPALWRFYKSYNNEFRPKRTKSGLANGTGGYVLSLKLFTLANVKSP